jgi:hypothetical protein
MFHERVVNPTLPVIIAFGIKRLSQLSLSGRPDLGKGEEAFPPSPNH